jgi:endonuclease-3
VVDTHVRRLSQRLGLTRQEDPVKIERDLLRLVPRADWHRFPHLLIWHGRRVCDARSPRCEACVLAGLCPSSRVDVAPVEAAAASGSPPRAVSRADMAAAPTRPPSQGGGVGGG